jgi:hypothetical protein
MKVDYFIVYRIHNAPPYRTIPSEEKNDIIFWNPILCRDDLRTLELHLAKAHDKLFSDDEGCEVTILNIILLANLKPSNES